MCGISDQTKNVRCVSQGGVCVCVAQGDISGRRRGVDGTREREKETSKACDFGDLHRVCRLTPLVRKLWRRFHGHFRTLLKGDLSTERETGGKVSTASCGLGGGESYIYIYIYI
jgi:hypothetical protein